MTEFEILLQRWKRQGIGLLLPVLATEVHATFRRAGALATDDAVALYEACGGMEEMDNEYWRLWSLREIEEENVEHSECGILFGDYLMNSWCYRLRSISEKTCAVYADYFDGTQPELVASTLAKFVAQLVKDPVRLLEQRASKRLK